MSQDVRKDESLNQTALKYPAPNHYKEKYEVTMTTTPKWSLYKNDRFRDKPKSAFLKRLHVPGPGKYEIKTNMGEGPSFSFGKNKYNHSDASDESMTKTTKKYPSPVTYYKNNYYNPSGPFYSISKLNRLEPGSDKYLLSCPGPMKYNPNKECLSTWTKFPQWGTSKSNRDEDQEVKGSKKLKIITPGPGNYNIRSEVPNGPKYSMAQKLKKREKEVFPGPSDYKEVVVHLPSEPKYSIGKSGKCDEIKQVEKDNFPGPKYIVQDVDLTRQISFPKEKKHKKINFVVPGPGQYRIPTAFDYINNMAREKGIFDPTYRYV